MPTGLNFVTKAMKIVGVLGQNETPNSGQADDGLISLNAMLSLWALDRTFAYTVTSNNFPLVNGQSIYTVGTGQNFNIPRPVTIDYAYIRLNNVDFPLIALNNQNYDDIPYKNNGGFPSYFYYDANFPVANLYLYGVPSNGMTIFLDTWIQLTQFSDLSTNLTFPPGYEMAIYYNLAKFICPEYGMSLTPEASEIAVSSLAMVRSKNLPSLIMKTEAPYAIGNNRWNNNGFGPWSY